MRRLAPSSATLLALVAGCSDSPSAPPDLPRFDPVLGRAAFDQACARCHASQDGFDLAFFSFTDTTIIRRAVAHVDTATARHIVAYVRTLQTPHEAETTRLFQPGGSPLASDLEFALALFGRDAWPAELTSADLAAIDPLMVRIAVPLPVWSDEQSNLDWMPDQPPPQAIMDYAGGLAAAAVAGYRAVPTQDNLRRAVAALRLADRALANPAAPCLLDDSVRVDYRQCFELRRWTSTLVAQHMLPYGIAASLGADVHDIWWDVGNAARKSRADRTQPVGHAIENWATWMFLGWSFDPSRHPSVYTGGGFRQLGLSRHATFIALRSQVARPRHSPNVYDDLVHAVRFSPASWTTSATTFALRHLLERLQQGDRPQRPEQIEEAKVEVAMALVEASRKVPAADRPALEAMAQEVLAALGN
ncbi:MAG TPA: hypothetical protein VGA42_06450 [Gemmatimonadales bacterium]